MRNLILQALSALALLIHPLSLSAQNSFSVSLDVNGASGDQAATSLNVSADQVVAIQIFGKDIRNANGLAVRFEYDANQVTYEGFDVGNVLPNAQALPEQGTNPTFVEIGIASLGGQATANSGLVGTIRFRATAAFSGTAIRLVRAELSRGGRFETIMPNIRIALQGAPTPANFSLSLDVDDSAGDQAVTSANVSTDEIVAIQIFGQDIRNANGLAVRFEYDASQVTYEGFDVGDVLPNAQALPEQGTNPTFVEIGIASLGGQATANNGLVGTIRFRTTAAFSGTSIQLVRAELSRGGRFEILTLNMRVALQSVPDPDFDGNGMVGFTDFLAFGDQFGTRQGDGKYEAKYDLDGDGKIGFSDFQIFTRSFGEQISSFGGGGSMETQVVIPDANLRAVIENSLGKASSAMITRADMSTLTRLDAPNANIRDLTGLEFANNLIRLDLGEEWVSGDGNRNSNEISDFSPLAGLPRLEWLDLSSNLVTDVSALAKMTRLQTLYLSDNLIADVSALSDLTRLESLNISSNLVADVSALSDLTRLESLHLQNNLISDVSALSGMTRLERLELYNNTISDIAPLSGLTNLTRLNIYNNVISDVSTLSGMTRLETLGLSNNLIADVSALSDLTRLEWLNISSNLVADVSALSDLTRLESLNIYSNVISDVSALSGMTRLETLGLSNNLISNISALSEMTRLEWLALHNNLISDVSALSGLTSLRRVSLDDNTISNLLPLSGLINLTELWLQSNGISDITLLSGLTNLVELYLSRNNISDLSPLVANTGLGSGDRVDVRNNPLSNTSLNTHIPVLQRRGVDVRFGASKPAVDKKERSLIPEDWKTRQANYN